MDPRLPAQTGDPPAHVHPRAHLDSVDTLAIQDGSITSAKFAASVYASAATISEVNPDDPQAAGASVTLARGDHGHAFPCAAASALTRTATNTEGSSSSSARADHGHSTDAIAWGTLTPQFSSTSSSVAYSATGVTDMLIDNITVLATRDYHVYLHSPFAISGASRWLVELARDGTVIDRFHDVTVGGGQDSQVSASVLWKPSAGTYDLTAHLTEVSGAATFQWVAAAAAVRKLWVVDVGPRT